jgi:PPOX class probable F420-dependent enzyme
MSTTAKLSDAEARLFAEGRNFGTFVTLRADGSPHATPVWVDFDGENVVINTAQGRAKYRHIKRDPRVAISVFSEENEEAYVTVSGLAEIVDEGQAAWEHMDTLEQKYRGRDQFPRGGPQRVLVRIRPTRVNSDDLQLLS